MCIRDSAILSGYLASFLLEWVRPIRFTVWMAIASGVAAGLSLMVKQTIGLGAVAAVPVVVAAMLWRRQSLRQALLWLASFAAGAAAPIGALPVSYTHLSAVADEDAIDRAEVGDLGGGAGEEGLIGDVDQLARQGLLDDLDVEGLRDGERCV